MRGVGEALEPLPGAPRVFLALARLGGGLSTAEVFRAWDRMPAFPPNRAEAARDALVRGDFEALRALAANALFAPAAALMPEIARGIDQLYAAGALYAQMTGSGSAVYGAFQSPDEAARAARLLGKGAIVTETLR